MIPKSARGRRYCVGWAPSLFWDNFRTRRETRII